jgi:hypothetical protein
LAAAAKSRNYSLTTYSGGFVVSLGQSDQVIIDHELKETPQLKA